MRFFLIGKIFITFQKKKKLTMRLLLKSSGASSWVGVCHAVLHHKTFLQVTRGEANGNS